MAQRSLISLLFVTAMSLAVLAAISPFAGLHGPRAPLAQSLSILFAARTAVDTPSSQVAEPSQTVAAPEVSFRLASLNAQAQIQPAQEIDRPSEAIGQNNDLFDSEASQVLIRELVSTLPEGLAAEQTR